MSVGKFLAGFTVGATVGAIIGLLFAPQSGEETRDMISEKSKAVSVTRSLEYFGVDVLFVKKRSKSFA